MQDVVIIGMLKSYIAQTLIGMGAQKGAACQIQGIVKQGTTSTITFLWEDNNGGSHTSTLTLNDGADEFTELSDVVITNLEDGEVLAYDSATHKWVNRANSATVASLENVGDVEITSIADGQFLKWDSTESKWVNVSLGDAAYKNSTNEVTEDSTDLLESGAAFSALEDKVDKVSGKGLSTNDLTDALVAKINDSVDSISVNGVAQTIEDGEVDIDVASNLITEAQWSTIGELYN